MKKVIFSLDVEDWYHLDYFDRSKCDLSYTLLDGLDVYIELLESLSIPSSFFVLGELAERKLDYFKDLVSAGHDVGSHGWDHQRPMALNLREFQDDLARCMGTMKKINGDRGFGYRAPCFSLDRQRLDIVRNSGFTYDSSRIEFGDHPLYGSIDMSGFQKCHNAIYRINNFTEFEVTTLPIFGKNIPISGGGYLRLFPWPLMKAFVQRHLQKNDLYIFYIHPFELSRLPIPIVPQETSSLTRFRFAYGRPGVVEKIKKLVDMLHFYDYQFTTFSSLQKEIVDGKYN